MTTLQMIESIHQVFPDVSKNQIRLDLDSAQKLLASETGSLTYIAELSNPSNNVAWNLPSNFVSQNDLTFYNKAGDPLYPEALNYKWQIEFNKLYVYTNEAISITGLNVASAYLHYNGLPMTLNSDSTRMEIAEQYRDALESYVLGKYFAKFLTPTIIQGQQAMMINLPVAKYHEGIYEKLRVKLKREFNSREKTDNHFINYSYPGKFYLPKRPFSSGTGNIVLSGLSEIYAKYAYFKFTSSFAEFPSDPLLRIGYTDISCSISGDTATLTSSGSFNEETIIIPNNWDATWVMNSSSEIVITLPSGWSTFAFEIYERV